jgi:hypothetical protein
MADVATAKGIPKARTRGQRQDLRRVGANKMCPPRSKVYDDANLLVFYIGDLGHIFACNATFIKSLISF